MERRKAIKTAAAASLTLFAGAAGIALNSGIVGANGQDKVGTLNPVASASSTPVSVNADAPPAGTARPSSPSVQRTNAKPVTTSVASGYRASNGHGGDDHYEGAEDDD